MDIPASPTRKVPSFLRRLIPNTHRPSGVPCSSHNRPAGDAAGPLLDTEHAQRARAHRDGPRQRTCPSSQARTLHSVAAATFRYSIFRPQCAAFQMTLLYQWPIVPSLQIYGHEITGACGRCVSQHAAQLVRSVMHTLLPRPRTAKATQHSPHGYRSIVVSAATAQRTAK